MYIGSVVCGDDDDDTPDTLDESGDDEGECVIANGDAHALLTALSAFVIA